MPERVWTGVEKGGFGGQKGSEKARVDYREALDGETFALFTRLRERRRSMAEMDAVPVYAVCTNEHLAEMARRKPQSQAGLREIEGFGEAKAAKYGEALLEMIRHGRNGLRCVARDIKLEHVQ